MEDRCLVNCDACEFFYRRFEEWPFLLDQRKVFHRMKIFSEVRADFSEVGTYCFISKELDFFCYQLWFYQL